MKTSILVFDHDRTADTVKARTLRIVGGAAIPKCAWCKVRRTRPLCSFVVEGPKTALQTVVCYCDDCHLATIVEYEAGYAEESEL